MNDSDILSNSTTYLPFNRFYDYLNEFVAAKISYFVIIVVTHVFGSVLVFGIISFERTGGDPQKRNVINRLFSNGLINHMLFCILVGCCRAWSMMFGLISSDVMIWIECFGYILCNNVMLFMNEMMILRYLQIIVWKRVKGLVDSFWASFLTTATVSWSIWQCVWEHSPLEVKMQIFQMSMEGAPESTDQKRYPIL